MIALQRALARSGGFFGIPFDTVLKKRAIYSVFRRINDKIHEPIGNSLLGRISFSPSRSFSSDICPLFYKNTPFPDGETMKEWISEHALLNTPEFQKNRLNIAIATLCADRFALRTMRDEKIREIVTTICTDLLSGKDEFTGESIQQFPLTNTMCTTLDKNLPLILQECIKKHAAQNTDAIDRYRVSGS